MSISNSQEPLMENFMELLVNYTYNSLNTDNAMLKNNLKNLEYGWIDSDYKLNYLLNWGASSYLLLNFKEDVSLPNYIGHIGHEIIHKIINEMYHSSHIESISKDYFDRINVESYLRKGLDVDIYDQTKPSELFMRQSTNDKIYLFYEQHKQNIDKYFKAGEPITYSWNNILRGHSIPSEFMPIYSEVLKKDGNSFYIYMPHTEGNLQINLNEQGHITKFVKENFGLIKNEYFNEQINYDSVNNIIIRDSHKKTDYETDSSNEYVVTIKKYNNSNNLTEMIVAHSSKPIFNQAKFEEFKEFEKIEKYMLEFPYAMNPYQIKQAYF